MMEKILLLLLLSASLQSAFAFELLGDVNHPWHLDNSKPVEYLINLGEFQNSENKQEIIQAINSAFELIESKPQVDIDFTYLGETTQLPAEDAVSVIYIDSDNSFVTGSGITLNYQLDELGIISSADIALSSGFVNSSLTNLYALTLHELLHFMGLAHSTTGNDSAVFPNTVNLDISSDDLAGLATLYPSEVNPLAAITGSISGRVLNHASLPVYARMVAYNQDPMDAQPREITNIKYDSGNFDLVGIPPGNYHIVAESSPASKFVHEYLSNGDIFKVEAGEVNLQVDLQLQRPPSFTSLFSNHLIIKSLFHEGTDLFYSASYPRIYALNRAGFVRKHIIGRSDDIAFSADQTELYSIDQVERTLKVIDLDPDSENYQAVIETIHGLPAQPTNLLVNSENLAFIGTSLGKTVVVFDMNNRTQIGSTVTNKFNMPMAFSANEKKAYFGANFNNDRLIIEINTERSSQGFMNVISEHMVSSDGLYIVKPDFNNRYLFVGTRSGVDIYDQSDFSLVHRIPTEIYITSIEPSRDGGYMYFLGYDNSELRNKQLWKFDINNLTVLERNIVGSDYQHISSTRVPNVIPGSGQPDRLLVSGQAGVAIISFDEITPIFSNSFE